MDNQVPNMCPVLVSQEWTPKLQILQSQKRMLPRRKSRKVYGNFWLWRRVDLQAARRKLPNLEHSRVALRRPRFPRLGEGQIPLCACGGRQDDLRRGPFSRCASITNLTDGFTSRCCALRTPWNTRHREKERVAVTTYFMRWTWQVSPMYGFTC